MTWLAIVVAVLAIWLAIKMVGALMKVVFWGVALVALYWIAAPHLDLPPILPPPGDLLRAGEPAPVRVVLPQGPG